MSLTHTTTIEESESAKKPELMTRPPNPWDGKAFSLESLSPSQDNACSEGVRYWREIGAPEFFNREQIEAIANDQPGYLSWCFDHGYFTTLPEGLSVGGYLFLRESAISEIPTKFKSMVIR